MKPMHHSSFAKLMQSMGYAKRHAYHGATPHYEKIVEVYKNTYTHEGLKTEYHKYIVIRVDVYQVYREGHVISNIGLNAVHSTYDETKEAGGRYQVDKLQSPGTLNHHVFTNLMEELNKVYALLKGEA